MLPHEINIPEELEKIFEIARDRNHSENIWIDISLPLLRLLLLVYIGVIYKLSPGLDLPQSL